MITSKDFKYMVKYDDGVYYIDNDDYNFALKIANSRRQDPDSKRFSKFVKGDIYENIDGKWVEVYKNENNDYVEYSRKVLVDDSLHLEYFRVIKLDFVLG